MRVSIAVLFFAALAESSAASIGGPLVVSDNPNYFKDSSGTPLILNGSHTWNTLQDWGSNGSLQALDFDAFVKFLTVNGHNFTLLWVTELPKFCSFPSTASSPPEITAGPFPWQRTGPGKAADGGPKFDLSKFNQGYFDRLRARTQALSSAGIYAGVYLFSGEWLNIFRCPGDGYPFTGANNVNGIDDGYTSGPKGVGSIAMTAPNAITRLQDAYMDKVIDTLNDLPNVLWVVSEEAPAESAWWNSHLIAHIREYESRKQLQHPIGYGTLIRAADKAIVDLDADFVKPQIRISPVTTCGSGHPRCKVNVNDSDHSYFGMWKDTPQTNRNYAWQNFMNGNQVLFMDPYAIVTGSGQGIGRAIAIAFAREGAVVVIATRTAAHGEETLRLIEAEGGKAIFRQVDIADHARHPRHGRRGRRHLRPARHHGPQRRRLRPLHHRGDGPRNPRSAVQRQRESLLHADPGVAAAHAQARRRTHHRHVLGHRSEGLDAGFGRLCHVEGRGHRLSSIPRPSNWPRTTSR